MLGVASEDLPSARQPVSTASNAGGSMESDSSVTRVCSGVPTCLLTTTTALVTVPSSLAASARAPSASLRREDLMHSRARAPKAYRP
ncbi:hypothetical protein PsYK624_005180 [Phanerochaete sordida]|uniref:Uncharacterized protein n=1 Tax=Phanerochaete sordida TaxID=48140 RepID=A0A9P3FWL7_9APHY|nr:hypothetical protein PsYK624_005180 [Phanerochaete sordida]